MNNLKAEEKLEALFTVNSENIKSLVILATGNEEVANTLENKYLMSDLAKSQMGKLPK